MKINNCILAICMVPALFTGCKEDTAVPSPVSELLARPGKNEAEIQFKAPADAETFKVFYNTGSWSEFDVDKKQALQTAVITGLKEGDNIIRVIAINSEGGFSDPKGTEVYVYGNEYQKKLANREYRDEHLLSETSTEVLFGDARADEEELRIVYHTLSGTLDSVAVYPNANSAVIEDIDLGKDYYFYSVYKPCDDFLGEFHTANASIPELSMKKLWKNVWKLDGFSDEDSRKKAENMIDDDISTTWLCSAGAADGHWLEIDMLARKKYDGFILVQTQKLENNSTFASRYRFESSDDGEEWTVVQEGRLGINGYRQKVAFKEPVISRYFRFTVTASYKEEDSPEIAEIDLYNDAEASGENGEEIPVLLNAQNPFNGDGSDLFPTVGAGRFQRALDWIHSDNAYISLDGSSFCVWCAPAWGCPAVENGKIYQSVSLLPGAYTFNIAINHTTSADGVDMYGVASTGGDLPDYDSVPSSENTLGYVDVLGYQGRVAPVSFYVEEKSDVQLGIVYNLRSTLDITGLPWSDMYIDAFELLP